MNITALATKIHKARTRFVERLNEVLEKKLFGREETSVEYVSSLEGKGDLNDYKALITERLQLRVRRRLCRPPLIGTHRDELEISLTATTCANSARPATEKCFATAAARNITVYNATRGEYPLFLLDDIDAELDYARIGQLLEYLEGKTQTFVTPRRMVLSKNFWCRFDGFQSNSGTPNFNK